MKKIWAPSHSDKHKNASFISRRNNLSLRRPGAVVGNPMMSDHSAADRLVCFKCQSQDSSQAARDVPRHVWLSEEPCGYTRGSL